MAANGVFLALGWGHTAPVEVYAAEPDGGSLGPRQARPQRLVALSRGAGALWLAGDRGLYRLVDAAFLPLTGVKHTQGLWAWTGPEPPPETLTTEGYQCQALAVDARGFPWIVQPRERLLYVFVPSSSAQVETNVDWCGVWYYTGESGQSCLGADPSRGVWLYTQIPGRRHSSLRHLDVEGTGEGLRVAVLPDTPHDLVLPSLANARMAVGGNGDIAVAGERKEGDTLVVVREGAARVEAVPRELSEGRRVTALALDRDGLVCVATDGAGVLMFADVGWQLHEVTRFLPALEGSGLKPVDDLLLTDDGTLYVACQDQVVIWRTERG